MRREKISGIVTDWLIIAMFSALLCIPLVLALTGPSRVYSQAEKRFLAKFPEFRLKGGDIRALTRAIDTFYQDHFGLREFLIHRYHREVNKRFAAASAPDVLTGKEGWLFYSGERVLEDLIGQHPLRREQLALLAARIRDTRDWLEQKGISYMPVVAPNKQSIYPEYLPDHYQQARKTSRLDQAVATLSRDPATAILDLRPVLLRNKGDLRLYDKTDTHWNQLGAYCGYRELIRVAGSLFPEADMQVYFSVGARWREDPAGDLAQLSGRSDTLQEKRPEVIAWFQAREHELNLSLQQLFLLEQMKPFLTVRQGKKLRVLVLHDSFMNPMKPFLAESFGEVLFLWKYFDPNVEIFLNREVMDRLLAEFKPDLVIDQIVERHLDWWIPQNSPQSASGSAR
ncbi:MAG TPA: hypothetical protein DDY20_06075 [Desulfobulbaceae bacterium]|nr:hypothetical protein [Desulfobulbaceae bacterium]